PSSTVQLGAGTNVTLRRPDFYELFVARTDTNTLVVTNLYVRFILNSSERAGTEWGLPPQVPFPLIASASNEFAQAHLRLLAPTLSPTGFDIPVVAWAENGSGHAVRANGFLSSSNHPSTPIKRGVGSGFLRSNNPAGPLNYAPNLQGLHTNVVINLESNT